MSNKFAQNPQRRPPAGWKVENWFFKTVLTQARRTNYPPLIQRVEQMKDAKRHDLVIISDRIARAANGLEDPALIDIDSMLEQDRKQFNETEKIQ
jgi:hypothetical protein